MINYYIKALQNYINFDGRATRPEFWYFTLFNIIIQIILSIFDSILGLDSSLGDEGLLTSIYNLAVLLPCIAVSIRRMHDINKSGWFILIPIYNLILACRAGTPGDNRFGPDPYGGPTSEVDSPVVI